MTTRKAGAAAATALALALALAATAHAQSAPAADAAVDVTGININGNTLLDSTRLAALLARYKGRRTLAELREATQAVQQAYVDAGYGAVVAYLPPQPVTDGTVTINIVEGKISKVTVKGNKRETDGHIRAALPTLQEGTTPRVRRIDSELQMANENPGREVGVLLGPGTAPGEVEATVNVNEQSQHRFNVGIDDTGNDRTGKYRLSAGYQNADLTGLDDVLSLQAQTSPSHPKRLQVYSAGYRLPMPRLLSAIDLFGAYSKVDGGTTAIGSSGTSPGTLSFNGSGRIGGARWVGFLPRAGEFDQRVTGGFEYRDYYKNDCSINVAGTGNDCNGSASNSVTVTPLSIDYSLQKGGALAAGFNVALAHNIHVFGPHGAQHDFDDIRADADRSYTVVRAGASIGVALPWLEDWQFNGRVNGQYTNDQLVPGEQFGLGGVNSLRGYDEREISTDRGISGAAEVWTPRLPLGLGLDPTKFDLRLLAFIDAGRGSNRGDASCNGSGNGNGGKQHCTLAGAGVGVRLAWNTVQARVYLANALRDGVSTDKGDWRTHLALYASF